MSGPAQAAPLHALDALAADVSARGLKGEDPLVVLCEDGTASPGVAQTLADAGATNVYVVTGGLRAVRADLGPAR